MDPYEIYLTTKFSRSTVYNILIFLDITRYSYVGIIVMFLALVYVGNVVVCSEQDNNNNDVNVLLPSVNFLTTEQLADQEDSNASSDSHWE